MAHVDICARRETDGTLSVISCMFNLWRTASLEEKTIEVQQWIGDCIQWQLENPIANHRTFLKIRLYKTIYFVKYIRWKGSYSP